MRLVDADKFRSELDNHYPFTKDEQSKHGMADIAKSTVLFVLNAMPTVDAVPVVRGTWIFVHCGMYKQCSECQSIYENDGCPDNFCPHCGADMRERREQDDS